MPDTRNTNVYVWLVINRTAIGFQVLGVFDSEKRAEECALQYIRDTPVMIEKHALDQWMRKSPREGVDEQARKERSDG